jgi:hypothetical protein
MKIFLHIKALSIKIKALFTNEKLIRFIKRHPKKCLGNLKKTNHMLIFSLNKLYLSFERKIICARSLANLCKKGL